MWKIIGMAAGVVILTVFLCMCLVRVVEWIGEMDEEKREKVAPVQPISKMAYVTIELGALYVMDAEDMDRARVLIRYDDRGIWKTESGRHGPWILVAEVDND